MCWDYLFSLRLDADLCFIDLGLKAIKTVQKSRYMKTTSSLGSVLANGEVFDINNFFKR